jgi:cytochrome b561
MMTVLTPSMFTMIEAFLLVIALMATTTWYLARGPTTRVGYPGRASSGDAAPSKYHPVLVVLHWFIAFAMANLLLRGALIMRYIPNNDPAKIDGLRAHMYAGTLVLALMLARLLFRRSSRLPQRATAHNSHLDRLARLSHRLLYVLVISQALSGLYMAVQTGLPDILIMGRGSLPPDFWVFPIRSVHYLVSRLLMATITLHIIGAMYHTFILKDGLLRRMSFGRRIAANEARKLAGNQTGGQTANTRPAL